MNTKKTNLKPIDYDVHLKYLCPQCGNIHWLSLGESQAKNFKVVCFCGLIFGVKRVKSCSIEYYKKSIKQSKQIPLDLLEKSVRILVTYGFTKDEASTMLSDSYSKKPVDDLLVLVKQTLGNLGETNVNECDQTFKI